MLAWFSGIISSDKNLTLLQTCCLQTCNLLYAYGFLDNHISCDLLVCFSLLPFVLHNSQARDYVIQCGRLCYMGYVLYLVKCLSRSFFAVGTERLRGKQTTLNFKTDLGNSDVSWGPGIFYSFSNF